MSKGKIKVKKKGNYLEAWDVDENYICAKYSKITKKYWGQTRCFPAITKALGKR